MERKVLVIWVISVQIWPLTWKVYAKCKLGVAVSREVCGNKLLMCFLFVAGRSYHEAWHKLLGLFRNISPSTCNQVFPFLSPSVMLLVAFIEFKDLSMTIHLFLCFQLYSSLLVLFLAAASPTTRWR